MDVYEIQTVVLECLRAAKVPRVLRTTIYSISGNPDEAEIVRKGRRNLVIVEFVASYNEFMTFRDCANSRGVWVSASWSNFGETDFFSYVVRAVEKY